VPNQPILVALVVYFLFHDYTVLNSVSLYYV
jgi:hypothetical protein